MDQTILMIEDDREFLGAVTALLRSRGYRVEEAVNGEEGFQKAQMLKPDLILLDVMMTRKTEGFDVVRRLKKHKETARIPVILITGIRKEFNLPFGFEADDQWLPVKTVLEKPIKPEMLLEIVEEALK